MSQSNDEIFDRIIAAVETNDIATIESGYSDDIRIWHGHDRIHKDKATGIGALAGLHVLGTPKYTVLERLHVGNRIAQRHQVVITSHDGEQQHRIDAAIFLTIENGQITEFHEYMDSGQVNEVGAAIARKMGALAPAS